MTTGTSASISIAAFLAAIASAEKTGRAIRDLYYLNQNYCGTTPEGKGYSEFRPFRFVQFDREHLNLQATRETLWNCLGYPQAERVSLPTNHYFDSLQIGDMIFIQRSSPQLLADLFPAKPDEESTPEAQAPDNTSPQ